MNKEIEVYSALCSLSVFEINGITADYDDFGVKEDISPETAADYSCGDMHFTPKLATSEILKKYNINVDEYNEICEELEDKLSFGSCGWCS